MTTTYEKRKFTYFFLDNIEDNYDEIVSYGATPEALFPGLGVVVCVETSTVEETITLAQFSEKYTALPPTP